ncbi:MAG: 16S rRNA (guanine(966)-N(2))-methyltransferase RsmD, partial [Lactobacillus delbrueckii]
MRIISGKYAKRNLFTLKSQKTRPTSDKVKESLFNSLGQFFAGGEVLDLYAGSGALGIEAVSRGCEHAVLNDVSRPACQIIRKNVDLTKEPDRFEVFTMPAKVALKVFADQERKFDLVFLDPPYAKQQMVKDMTALASLDLLKPGAKIVVETDEQTDLPPVAGFDLLKDHHMGKT